MPPTNQYFLNPSAGFTPSQGLTAKPTVDTGQTGIRATPYMGGSATGQPKWQGVIAPGRAPTAGQGNVGTQQTAIRPTDQSNNPQSAYMQNLAAFAGGNLAGSTAFGNQPTGPVRRLVDVLGQQPFGEQNPMTLLMQALQNSNFGIQMPDQTQTPAYKPPTYSNPTWGGPSRPGNFNPMQQMVPY